MIHQIKLHFILSEVKQIDLAKAAGVDKAYINRIVNGQQKASKKVVEAAKKLNLPSTLFGDEG